MEESTVPFGSGLPVGGEVINMEPAGKFIKKVTEVKIDISGKCTIETTCTAVGALFTIGL